MTAIQDTLNSWTVLDADLRSLVSLIETEAQYERALSAFEALMELVAQDPQTPLTSLYLLLGEHLHAYERQRRTVADAAPHEVLRFLMDQHGLTQADLPEVGSQGVVSELLSGKRQINARQARSLAQRFGVGAGLFV